MFTPWIQCVWYLLHNIYIYTYNLPTYTTKIYPFKVGIIIYSLIKNHHLHGVVVVSVKAFFCVIKFDLTCHGGKKTATEAQVDQDMKKEQDRKAGTERKKRKRCLKISKVCVCFFLRYVYWNHTSYYVHFCLTFFHCLCVHWWKKETRDKIHGNTASPIPSPPGTYYHKASHWFLPTMVRGVP